VPRPRARCCPARCSPRRPPCPTRCSRCGCRPQQGTMRARPATWPRGVAQARAWRLRCCRRRRRPAAPATLSPRRGAPCSRAASRRARLTARSWQAWRRPWRAGRRRAPRASAAAGGTRSTWRWRGCRRGSCSPRGSRARRLPRCAPPTPPPRPAPWHPAAAATPRRRAARPSRRARPRWRCRCSGCAHVRAPLRPPAAATRPSASCRAGAPRCSAPAPAQRGATRCARQRPQSRARQCGAAAGCRTWARC
jgi:hypothetical protein